MKRALLTVLIVAACSFLETALLLGAIVPRQISLPSAYQSAVLWGQLVIIPGMAALLSRLIYRDYQWFRRTATILAFGSLGVPLAMFAFFSLFAFLTGVLVDYPKLANVLIPAVLIAFLYLGGILFRNSGNWGVRAEAERWLADCKVGTTVRGRKLQNRSIRLAVCASPALVLLVFLFFPQTWALFSRMAWPQAGNLVGYRMSLPATWIILFHQNNNSGRSWETGFAAKSIAQGGNPFRYDTFSSWLIGTTPFVPSQADEHDRRMPKEQDVMRRSSFVIGAESVTCVEYQSLNYSSPEYSYWPGDYASVVHVKCRGNGRFFSGFDGTKDHLGTFYRMMAAVTQVKE